VHGVFGRDVFGAMVAEGGQVEAGEEVLAGAKEDRAQREMQLLPNGRGTSADSHVFFHRGLFRAL
jgi:hypothetical protein